jgi:hypothetical protein
MRTRLDMHATPAALVEGETYAVDNGILRTNIDVNTLFHVFERAV